MNEIVKYHNDFNKIKLPNFTELEQNLLFGMLTKIKNSSECEFSANELKSFISDKNPTNTELYHYANALGSKFFKADFTEIRKISDTESVKSTYNLFKEYSIFYLNNDNEKILTRIKIEINEVFAYLVNELTANFTRFELAEFIALSGKYTKTLYRLLKQYRNTGYLRMEWDEFARIMDIPADYRQIDINERILKPALKELTKERNLFDTTRIPFENLTCTKLNKNKKKCNKGDRVRHILFEWKPEERKIDCKDFYSDFAEKHSGKTFYFNGYGKFVFKGLGKNLEGDRIFIFEDEEMARYSEKINDYPTKNSLEKLAKKIIDA
ncbi:replication initiation protein [Campylobacter coli]|nr:replication initiation protein [Campylobacter coli]